MRPADAGLVDGLARHLSCPVGIAHLLVSRNLAEPVAADAFLHPALEQLLSPDLLHGMAAAVERILAAIRNQDPILIYGDYDVDGTTATVLLKTAIERVALTLDATCPATVTYHVPHRIREGYGMQTKVLGLAAGSGIRLVISVDTGIRAFAAADECRALALDLIITDHHLPDEIGGIPDAIAVINPNQPACTYPNKHLCGAAVAFKLAHALLLAAVPHASDPASYLSRLTGTLIPSFLKLVALATIADSVPLTGENRAIAALGLAALANPVQPGLRALMQVAKLPLDRAPTAMEVGFRLAPRINAAGRMDIAGDVVELFLTRSPERAQMLAVKLDALNQARRATEAAALSVIERDLLVLLADSETYPADCLILDHPEWHRGVLGILASRVVDRTGRPALVLTHADGDAHGSGRSIPGFHLLDALTAVHAASPLFHRFGGHAHAVGFSLPSASLPELRDRMSAHAAGLLTAPMLTPHIDYDAELTLAEITPDLHRWLLRCAPYGMANAEPVFLTRNATLSAPVRLMKDIHLCLQLARKGSTISALGWTRAAADWPARCVALGLAQGSRIDLLYRIRHNPSAKYGGLELELCELRAASESAPCSPD
jgi:single-stranded-DNA-specific exonuclease